MLNSPIIKILRTFNPDEFKRLKEFLDSPYFNKKTGAVQLYDVITKYSPDFKNPKLDRKEVWKELFPDEEFNYGIMKNIIYDLTRLAEKFLIIETENSGILRNNQILLDALYSRNLKDLFISKFTSLEKNSYKDSFDENLIREDYYHIIWRSYKTKWNFEMHLNHSKNYVNIINLTSDYFIASFLIHSFIVYHNIVAQKYEHNYFEESSSMEILIKNADKTGLIKKIIDNIKPLSKNLSKVLEVYYKMYCSLANENSAEKYFDFKDSINLNSKLFSKKDLQALFIMLRNCLNFLQSNSISNSEETLEIYDSMIKSNIFLIGDETAWDQEFLAYITLAANLGKSGSLEKFIKKFSNKLQKDTQENLLMFANAHLLFTKGEFIKALEIISKTSFNVFPMKYYTKNLQLKIFYELNEYDSFLMAQDSFIHFLNKNKMVSERWKDRNKILSQNINRLFKLRQKFDEFEFRKFKKELIKDTLKQKSWVLRKITELEIENN